MGFWVHQEGRLGLLRGITIGWKTQHFGGFITCSLVLEARNGISLMAVWPQLVAVFMKLLPSVG